jgi:hypothetical protein
MILFTLRCAHCQPSCPNMGLKNILAVGSSCIFAYTIGNEQLQHACAAH